MILSNIFVFPIIILYGLLFYVFFCNIITTIMFVLFYYINVCIYFLFMYYFFICYICVCFYWIDWLYYFNIISILNAILLNSSVNALCFSLLNFCHDFNINLLFLLNSLLVSLKLSISSWIFSRWMISFKLICFQIAFITNFHHYHLLNCYVFFKLCYFST